MPPRRSSDSVSTRRARQWPTPRSPAWRSYATTGPQLALPGDDATKGFWAGEHLQVDQTRTLVFLARDPRSFGGTLQTGQPGLYVIDARDPRRLRLVTFHATPARHTTGRVEDCRYLWTGGPYRRITPTFNGQPVWVTKLAGRPYTYPPRSTWAAATAPPPMCTAPHTRREDVDGRDEEK